MAIMQDNVALGSAFHYHLERMMSKPRFCQPKRSKRRLRRERAELRRWAANNARRHRDGYWPVEYNRRRLLDELEDHRTDVERYVAIPHDRLTKHPDRLTRARAFAEAYGMRGTFHDAVMRDGHVAQGSVMGAQEYASGGFVRGGDQKLMVFPHPDATLRDRVFGADYGMTEARLVLHGGDFIFDYKRPDDLSQEILTKLHKQMSEYMKAALHRAAFSGSSKALLEASVSNNLEPNEDD